MTTKILTVGPVLGAYSSLVTKVKAIDAKHGKFDMVICVGDFFADPASEDAELNALLDGKLEVPIATYVMQGGRPIPDSVLKCASENSGQICSNLFLLEKFGVITTSQKLTIASFGGKYDPQTSTSESQPLDDNSESDFNSHNLSAFLSSALLPAASSFSSSPQEPTLASLKSSSSHSQIDILLTNAWPSSITHHSKTAPSGIPESSLVSPLNDVVKASKPRYHFASSEESPIFWEREPYIWDGDLVSRFISLGSFGVSLEASGKKQRWFYAFSITSPGVSLPPTSRPTNATISPFGDRNSTKGVKRVTDDSGPENYIFGNVQMKKPRLVDRKPAPGEQAGGKSREKPPEGYICRICKSTEHYIRDCPEKNATGDTGGKKPPRGYVCRACGSDGHFIQDCPNTRERERQPRNALKDITPDECWFCLSNPRLTKHLIVSIGTEVYLTLPKGQLPPTGDDVATPTHVPGGGHCLLIPVSHYPTLSTIPNSLAPSVLSELDTYKTALGKLYSQHGAVPVCFEVSRNSGRGAGGHAHVQVIPVPEDKKDGVEEAFRAYGGMQMSWEKDPLGALSDAAEKGQSYFRVDLPDGRKMVHILKQGRPFNLQFGREALAHFLDLGDRADWKACSQTEDEEIRDAQALKESFAEFDPSML